MLIRSWEDKLVSAIDKWRSFIAKSSEHATIDFETRSACDLKARGAWLYSKDPTTTVMCLAYKLPGQKTKLWHMAHPDLLISESAPPTDLFAFIIAGGIVEAHNAFFERCIWQHVCVPRMGWPAINALQWRCSAARSSACSLPRDLDGACMAMELSIQKDMDGNKIMKKISKPRKPSKAEREAWEAKHGKKPMPILWHENEDEIEHLWSYCLGDVEAEHELSQALPPLSDYELRVWQADQALNQRGVKFDLALARSALNVAKTWKEKLNEELEILTGIDAGTKRGQVLKWLRDEENLELPDTKSDTLEWAIEDGEFNGVEVTGRARRVMEITVDVNRTSTRKYSSMLNYADPADGRIRDLLMYHGAGTGRWSGKGVQVQNFPSRNLIVKDQQEAAECILSEDAWWCHAMYGDVMKLLSHALRGAIIPEDGKHLMVADYAAIEARCVLWLAGATEALEIFNRGEDIYCDMATGIYGYTVEKKTHPDERQFGKQAILGLGYGMGFITFLLTCRKYGMKFTQDQVFKILGPKRKVEFEKKVRAKLDLDGNPEKSKSERAQARRDRNRLREARIDPAKSVHELALMMYTVQVYRQRYGEVKTMWKDQEAAAIQAVMGGEKVKCGMVTWEVLDGWLHCWLPSGRPIRYRSPSVREIKTSWGEIKPALRYYSVNGVTRKWERTATYGGKIVENITQAVARDFMAGALLRAHEGDDPYTPIMTVHDELVAEVDENEGSIEDFERVLCLMPSWGAGCPIDAEAKRLLRYEK